MTSPNDPGRDDEKRDGQDSATSTPAEEQAQEQSAATSEQGDKATEASSEQAADTTEAATAAAAAGSESEDSETEKTKAEDKQETKAEGEKTKAEGEQETKAGGSDDQVAAQEHASGLGEELAQDVEKKRTGLLVGIVAAVVVVLAALGVGAYFLFSGPSAQKVAEGYAEISNKETQDPASVTVNDYKPYVCSKAMPQIEAIQKQKELFLKQAKPEDLQMLKQVHTSVKNVSEQGDAGKVVLEQTVPGQGPQQLNLNLIQEDGWKLCA